MTTQAPQQLPAGLELFFQVEKQNIRTPLQAFVLALHWAVMRGGLRVKIDQQRTEKLPQGWALRVDGISTSPIVLDYVDQDGVEYQVKVIEVSPNDTVVVTLFSPRPPPTRTSSATTFHISSFIAMSTQVLDPHSIYFNSSEMEKKIWSELLEPLGLRVMGQAPVPGPYEDKNKKEAARDAREARERDTRDPYYTGPGPVGPGNIGGPLYVPPVGGGGLGRSDLDPLGGVGTGMIADPRGFRGIRPPIHPGVPPGARFDPFGPPGQGPRPPGPRPGGPNWAVPNPDHEQPPPGFEDMFM